MDAFKAIADPTRREILNMLSKKDMNAGDIAEHFQMSKPAISNHLDILKNSDLISCEKQGQYVVYSINTTAVQNIYRKFLEVFDGLQGVLQNESTEKK